MLVIEQIKYTYTPGNEIVHWSRRISRKNSYLIDLKYPHLNNDITLINIHDI